MPDQHPTPRHRAPQPRPSGQWQQPAFQPPGEKRHTRQSILLSIAGLVVVLGVIGAAVGAGHKPAANTASTRSGWHPAVVSARSGWHPLVRPRSGWHPVVRPRSGWHPAAVSTTTPLASAPSPPLTSGDAAFVAAVRSALSSSGFSTADTDAQIAALGDSICSVLGDGGTQSALAAVVTNRKAENDFHLTSRKVIRMAHRDICPHTSVAPS